MLILSPLGSLSVLSFFLYSLIWLVVDAGLCPVLGNLASSPAPGVISPCPWATVTLAPISAYEKVISEVSIQFARAWSLELENREKCLRSTLIEVTLCLVLVPSQLIKGSSSLSRSAPLALTGKSDKRRCLCQDSPQRYKCSGHTLSQSQRDEWLSHCQSLLCGTRQLQRLATLVLKVERTLWPATPQCSILVAQSGQNLWLGFPSWECQGQLLPWYRHLSCHFSSQWNQGPFQYWPL